ncbi:ATP-grasp domain-containing protein [Nitrosarchaeum koreense]|uniref:Carbamoyl phosphate synthase-like protein n=1 Tax=Nitrosarchaeum koreense MY1 TaxID=1001994 RepID=F9CYA6_9ARCH|nr:ATP-grasp domain-containing protein [Nitrosarchaeum koreense]EGP92884.1 carbamoyl phosphate synthase-like protein [Nitrosarchaeum koreense MY1]
MNNSDVCVLVTGVGGGSLGREIIKAFKIAPHNYKIVATDASAKSVGLFETSHRYIVPEANSEKYLTSIQNICSKEKVQVIVPGSEPETEIISKNKKLFSEKNITVLTNPWETIQTCKDKLNLTNFLTSKGIPCPKSILFENDSTIKQIEQYPVVIKPRSGAGSRNVFLAHDENEAKFFGNYLLKHGSEAIIQEYVGDYEAEYTIGILYADNGKLMTSIAMKRLLEGGLSTRQITKGQNNDKKYVISSGISQGEFNEFTEVRKAGESIAKVLATDGPINIQCRKTKDGILPFEINPRFSGTTGSRSLVGCNEPDILCRYRLFGEIPQQLNYEVGFVLRDLQEKFITQDDIEKIPKI